MTAKDVYGRQQQYNILLRALTGVSVPPAIFLHGLPSSGKSFVVEKVISECKGAKTAKISAAEALCGKRAFFETILRQLELDKYQMEKHSKFRCESSQIYLHMLQESYYRSQDPLIIVVENVELLNKEEYREILIALLIGHNICHVKVCFILCSTLPYTSFSTATKGLTKTVPTIYFPQYSKDEIVKIIVAAPPPNADLVTFKSYVTTLVNVFYRNCRELRKLWRLATANYSSFIRPLTSPNSKSPKTSNEKDIDIHKLWKNIEPKLKKDFFTLNSQFLPFQKISVEPENRPDEPSTSSSCAPVTRKMSLAYDLPEYSKYILIASFLASNNPPSSDKRFFVKAKAKVKTTSTFSAKRLRSDTFDRKKRVSQLFPYSRLQAIFSAICSNNFLVRGQTNSYTTTQLNTAHMSQIMTLCDARLISVGGGEDTLENRKFKCLADFDLVDAISRTVDIDLTKYLYDFL